MEYNSGDKVISIASMREDYSNEPILEENQVYTVATYNDEFLSLKEVNGYHFKIDYFIKVDWANRVTYGIR